MQSGAPDLRIILATKDNNISLLSSLIGEKADVNGQDSTNESALSWAAYSGFTECMQLLIQAKAKINEQHSYGFTPLFEATRWNKKDCLKILVAEKADVNVTSYNNETPLMRAARNGYLACVEILLEAKADIHHKNDKGDTALTNANYLCIGRLISAGALPGNTIKDSPASLLKEMENIDFRDKHTLVAIKKITKIL